ncbi:MAG: 5-oxoprolinase subunit PxpB [Verrucomicrobiota bacterium]
MNGLGNVMSFKPLGDAAVVLTFEHSLDEALLAPVRAVADAIERERLEGVADVVPAFATVTVFYDPVQIKSYAGLCAALQVCVQRAAGSVGDGAGAAGLSGSGSGNQGAARVVEIPVCYHEEFGPDLSQVAKHASLTVGQIVVLHSGANYFVQAMGFAPGFAYLGGLPGRIHTPRRATPRTQVPAGAVGIGGALTGVYPLATPGGWNLIGRTPLRMFDPARPEPALLRAGDRVRFRVIHPKEFAAWK